MHFRPAMPSTWSLNRSVRGTSLGCKPRSVPHPHPRRPQMVLVRNPRPVVPWPSADLKTPAATSFWSGGDAFCLGRVGRALVRLS